MPPIETTTGLPAAAAASSSRMISEAVTLPPGLFTRRTMALFSDRGAHRERCGGVAADVARVSSPSMMAPLAKITAMAEPGQTASSRCSRNSDRPVLLSALLQPNCLVSAFSTSVEVASSSTSLLSSAYFAVSPPTLRRPSIMPGAREELLGGDLAVGGNGVEVVLPQFANPAAIASRAAGTYHRG